MQLQIVEHQNQRILTTQQLAEFYGTNEKRISENFSRNKDRYSVGKHYFCLEGEALEQFKSELLTKSNQQFAESLKGVSKLYLWTEKGALHHAKSLNTDKAWEKYEWLVDDYYRKTEQLAVTQQQLALSQDTIKALLEQMRQIPWGLSRAETALAEMAMYRILRLTEDAHMLLQKRSLSEKQVQELTTLLTTLHEETVACHETLKKDIAVNWQIDTVCIHWDETLRKALPAPKNDKL